MKIIKEHKNLLASIIKQNQNYRGNEELLDIFIEASYKKSYLIIDAIRDEKRLKRHLTVICDNCIEQIIKEKQRYSGVNKKSSEFNGSTNIVSVKKSPFAENEDIRKEISRTSNSNDIINLKEEIQQSEKYDTVDMLIDPINYSPKKRVSENTVEKLILLVKKIDSQYPNKKYYEIFTLRYMRKYNQTEIAKQMKISQVELSKRFVELVKLVRDEL